MLLAAGLDPGVAVVALDDLVGDELRVLLGHRIVVAAADQALDREDGVFGIGDRLALGRLADQPLAVLGEGDDRRRGARAFRILDDLGVLAVHDGDAGVGRAEVDTDYFCHFFVSPLSRLSGPMRRSGDGPCSQKFPRRAMRFEPAARVAAYIRTGFPARKPCTARSPEIDRRLDSWPLAPAWRRPINMHRTYCLRMPGTMQGTAEELRLENIVGALSLAMVDKMEQAFAAETGRGPSAVAAITQIGLEPGLSIERLRRIIALSHSAAVRLIDQLAAEGLVRRDASGGFGQAGAGARPHRARREALQVGAGRSTRRHAGRARAGCRRTSGACSRASSKRCSRRSSARVTIYDVVCRLCDAAVCPMERCPVPQPGHAVRAARAWLARHIEL